jgi:NitT/TauT family transport system substrate-binding protein
MSWAHINGSALVVGKHVDADDFKDLGGLQIAVPYWYSMHNIVLQMGLRSAGLKPVIKDQKDPLAADEVNLLIMPPPDMPPALAAKKIDAFIVAEPFNAFGELKAGGKMLRFTGDMWKNHPCCVVCMNEQTVAANPTWTQKVMNAIVRAEIYAQEHKEEVALMMSKDGKGYLPMPGKAVVRAMTFYDENQYNSPHAIRNKADFANGRIDFSPYPYPSATKLIVNAMNETLVGGDTTFLAGLDPQFVADDLVDYQFVKAAMAKYPGWEKAPGVDPANPYEREEVVRI